MNTNKIVICVGLALAIAEVLTRSACIGIADAGGGQVTYDAGVIGIRAPDKHGLVLRTAQLHGWHGAAVI